MHLSDWPRTVEEWWRQTWTPPANLNPWKWAERHLELSSRSTAYPGKYSTALTPYVRTILEDFKDPSVRQITMCFSAQAAKTQTLLTALAYSIDQDPGPVLLVQSSMDAARSFSRNRLQPLLEDAPVLARHKTDNRFDFTSAEMRLDNCSIYLQGAGNPAQLASRPIRFLFCDETDKWPDESSKEADSLSLAMERVKSYRNHKILLASTPTLATGPIWQAYTAGDQRRYQVPCPRCGAFFVMQWAHVKWPEDAALDVVAREAWIECPHCQGTITERHKAEMLAAGEWIASNTDAPEERRSYHLSELYSPFTTWGSLAQKFVVAAREAKQGNTGALHNFVNSSLAEPWEELHGDGAREDDVLALRTDLDTGLVPLDVVGITAGVDTQDNGFYFTLWAWGPELTGHLIREGFVADFALLESVLWRSDYRDEAGNSHPLRCVLIDSQGHRTDEVYNWCRRTPLARPIRGEQRISGQPLKTSVLDSMPGKDGKRLPIPGGLQLVRIDTNHFKTLLAGKLKVADGPGGLTLHKDVSRDFVKHFCSEYQASNGVWRKPSHKRCDLWDCSVYALAGAELLGTRYWRPVQQEQHKTSTRKQQPRNKWW